jgi:Outer membrane protein beta-barrel domain
MLNYPGTIQTMRNTILLFTILCFYPLSVHSQNTFLPETNLGFKLGGTLSRVGFDPKIDQGLNIGFTGGLVYKHISQKNLGIQLEINYMQIGWSENLDLTNSYSRRLDYIHVPFMTHACVGNRRVRFVLNLGPQLSFLVSDYEKIAVLPEEEQVYYRKEIENQVDFGFCLGGGLIVKTSIGLFQVEGRINYALSNIFQYSSDSPFTAAQNQAAELTLSYLLDSKNIRKAFSRK